MNTKICLKSELGDISRDIWSVPPCSPCPAFNNNNIIIASRRVVSSIFKMELSLLLFASVLLSHLTSALHLDGNFIDDHTPAGLPTSEMLHLSAVVNTPKPPYHAVVECWELSSPFIQYPPVGKALSLGDTANATYVVLPPYSAEGWHRPPSPM